MAMHLARIRAYLPIRRPPRDAEAPDAAVLRARVLVKRLTQHSEGPPAWPAARGAELLAAMAARSADAQLNISASIRALADVDALVAFDAEELVAQVAPWDASRRQATCLALCHLRQAWAKTYLTGARSACLRAAVPLASAGPAAITAAEADRIVDGSSALKLSISDLPSFFADLAPVPPAQRALVLAATVAVREPGRGWDRCDEILCGLAALAPAPRVLLVELVESATRVAGTTVGGASPPLAALRDTTCAALLHHPPARWPEVVAHLKELYESMAGRHLDAVCFAVALRRRWPLPAIERRWPPSF